MPEYVVLPIDTEPEDIKQDAIDYLQARITGWQPNPASLDTLIIEAIALMAADVRDIASQVPDSIFRYFGASLLVEPPIDATPASVSSTWTAVDTAGYTVNAGTQVGIRDSAGALHPFYVQTSVVIPSGVAATAAGAVQLIAVDAGLEGSNLAGPGIVIELIDPVSWVASIVTTGFTTGGVDAESDTDYLNRLRGLLQLLAPRPILPRDFAEMAKTADPGVYRAVAVDGYNPADATFNNARMVTIFMVDATGNPVSSTVKANVDAYLQARRETTFVVNEADPTVTQIDVTVNVVAQAGYDHADLLARVTAAIQSYLSPATWGTAPTGDSRDWTNVTVVRYLELAQLVNDVAGVDYITTTGGNYDLTVGVHGGALGRADVALTGVAPLPSAFTVTVTVAA